MLWNGSEDLKLVIIALNNSMTKRVELASRATTDLLNKAVFSLSGPLKSLAGYLGATGERAGEIFFRKLFPRATRSRFFQPLNESAARPLVKGNYNPDLHLAIGMLLIFNAEDNNLEVGGEQQCDFHKASYIQGAGALDAYGPLFFVIAQHILPKLCPMLGDMFCKAKTPEQVDKVMHSAFTR
jgi:hypothetical protein